MHATDLCSQRKEMNTYTVHTHSYTRLQYRTDTFLRTLPDTQRHTHPQEPE